MTNDIAAFLTSQRTRITPSRQGCLPTASGACPLELAYEALELPADAGVTRSVYTAEPGSASAEALDLLASWVATLDQETAKT
jgi:hypothetical protein